MHPAIVVCRIIKRFMFILIRYPCYNHSELEKEIVTLSLPEEDLKEYLSNTSKERLYVLLPATVFFVYFLKSFFAPLYSLSLYDLSDVESNIKQVDDKLYEFTCMITNCTSIMFNSTLADDLAKLPVFALCNPKLSSWFHVSKFGGVLGCFIFSMIGFGILILGSLLSVQQIVAPSNNDSYMYAVAPSVERLRICNRMCDIIVDMANSFVNFRTLSLRRTFSHCQKCADDKRFSIQRSTLKSPATVRKNNSKQNHTSLCEVSHDKLTKYDNKQTEYTNGHAKVQDLSTKFDYTSLVSSYFYITTNQEFDAFVHDSLTIIRSGEWWQIFLAKLYLRALACFAAACLLMAYSVVFVMTTTANQTGRLMKQYAKLMNQAKCALWYLEGHDQNHLNELISVNKKHDQLEQIATIDLSLIDVRWDTYNALETTFCVSIPVAAVICAIIAFHLTISELTCWTEELRFQVQLAIEFSRFQLNLSKNKSLKFEQKSAAKFVPVYSKQANKKEVYCQKFSMLTLKQVFKEHTGSILNFVTIWPMQRENVAACERLNSHLESKLAHQELALSLMLQTRTSSSDQDNTRWQGFESLLEMNEKVYINFRLYVESIARFAPPVATMIIHDHVLNYGSALIALWYRRKIPSFTTEPMILISVSLAVSFYSILMASSIHAKVSS